MRFVDEFRDPEKARVLAARIAALCEPGRRYKFMEVCGGHTHTIYKHGLEDYLPPAITLVHGPGCPVCVIPMGRVDDAIHIAEQPDVIMASFGDMMRVPGGRGSFLDANARGADIRMVYSPLDALKIARQNPGKRVVFMAIGFETTAPSTALTLLKAAARRSRELLRLLQPRDHRARHQGHPRLAGSPPGRVHRPRPRLDGDRLPALRVHRAELRQARGGCRLRAARHPAVGVHAPAAAGRAPRRGGKPVHARGAVGREPACAPGHQRGDDPPALLRVAGARASSRTRPCACPTPMPPSTPSAHSESRACRVADPKACQCGEVLKGVLKPWECKVFGTACTPETPIGTCMVSSEGACAAYYNFGRFTRERVREAATL